MKVAVTSQGKELSSEIDPRFGRAKWLLVVDTETGLSEAYDNAVNLNLAQGAGISSAKAVIDACAEVVLTGNCGPNAERTLSAAGVKLYTGVAGTVSEAIELFRNGKLAEAAGPNVQSHFGTNN